MKFSECMRKGIQISLPAKGRYIVHGGKDSETRACAVGAAMLGKVGAHAHCVSITEVRKEFPDIPAHILLEIARRNDFAHKGQSMNRSDIADWVESKGY